MVAAPHTCCVVRAAAAGVNMLRHSEHRELNMP